MLPVEHSSQHIQNVLLRTGHGRLLVDQGLASCGQQHLPKLTNAPQPTSEEAGRGSGLCAALTLTRVFK